MSRPLNFTEEDSSSSSKSNAEEHKKSHSKKDCKNNNKGNDNIIIARKVKNSEFRGKKGKTGKNGRDGLPGPPGPPGICCCFSEKIDLFNTIFSTANQTTTTFNLSYTGGGTSNPVKVPNIKSYVNITCTNSLYLPQTVYNGWCANIYNNINTGTSYTFETISFLDASILSSNPSVNPLLAFFQRCDPTKLVNVKNIPAILYILNKASIYEVEGLTSDDIQTAIWTLLFAPMTSFPYSEPLITDPTAPSFIAAHVYLIINQALTAQNQNTNLNCIPLLFPRPTMGLFLIPEDTCNQVMIFSVQLDQINLNSGANKVLIYLNSNSIISDGDFIGSGTSSTSFIQNNIILPEDLIITALMFSGRNDTSKLPVTATLCYQNNGLDSSPTVTSLSATIPAGSTTNCMGTTGNIPLKSCNLLSVRINNSSGNGAPVLANGVSITLVGVSAEN